MNQDMSNKIITYLNASQKVSQRAGRIVPLLLLFLMLILGSGNVWGQTDYSGTYYIGTVDNTNGFYLCPTSDYYFYDSQNEPHYTSTPNGNPFLTTYKCKNTSGYDAREALWIIEKHPSLNYYYIKHASDKKYLTYNDAILSNKGRLRVHLEESPAEDDYALFKIEYYSASQSYDIISKYAEDNDIDPDDKNRPRKYLNINKGNKQDLKGTNTEVVDKINVGGIIGLWSVGSAETQATGRFFLEEYIPRPTITNTSSNIKIDHSGTGATIYYTIDCTNPTTTNHTGSKAAPLQIDMPENAVTLKAIATIDDLPSCISEIRVVPNPTISLNSSPLIYNGSKQEPTFSLLDGETSIPESEYTISEYSNNKNAGTATVTISDNTGGDYIICGSPTFTIDPKPLSITANDNTITYGSVPTSDGVTYGEFVTGESKDNLSGTLTYAYSYSQYDDVGNTYTITPGGLTSSNYDITFVAGTLTVDQREIGLTWSETTSFPYDGTSHGLTATATNLVNGDEIGVTVSGVQTNAGNHTATASALTGEKAGNYKLPTEKTHAFTITPAELTVTAKNHSITYGDAPAGNGVTYEGFVEGDDESELGTLGYDYSYTQFGDVGTYTITPKGLTSDNYDISFVAGTLTVGQKEVGITWDETTSFPYDGLEHAPTATATGLVNNDEVGVTVTGAQTNVGTDYIATASALTGEKKDNYLLPEGLTHTFTITPKSIGDGNKAADDIIIEISSEGELSVVKQGEKILVEDTDYTQETEKDGNDIIITITGMGNYTGSVKVLFANSVFTDPDGTGSEKAAAVYMASRDLSAPTGIDAYIVRKVNPSIGTLVISKLDYIPEGVPVLLLSDAETSGFVVSPKEEAIPEITAQTKNSNQLKVSQGGETVEAAQIYMFYKGEFVLTKAGTLGEGKYYLYNPNFKVTPAEDEEEDEPGGNPTNSRGVLRMIFEDETTGIDDLKNEKTEEWKLTGWYSLDGRRLSGKPTKGGIYIHKGQKIYIKRK